MQGRLKWDAWTADGWNLYWKHMEMVCGARDLVSLPVTDAPVLATTQELDRILNALELGKCESRRLQRALSEARLSALSHCAL